MSKNKLGLNEATIEVLVDAWDYCDDQDKSTEFMFQYMADMANVDYDTVVEFVISYDRKTKTFQR